MKRRIVKSLIIITILLVLAIAITVIAILFFSKIDDKDKITDIIISVSIECFIAVMASIWHTIRNIFVRISETREYSYNSKYRNKIIRLSFAYLIRIRVYNKYLLVKSGHKRDLYGPVGGVYHIKHIDYVYNKLGISRDETPGDPNDVRGKIRGKNIKKFIKWFEKKEEREIAPYREYEEELIKTSFVPESLFTNVNFKFVKTCYRGIDYDQVYKKDELCRFDIYDLVLNDEQIKCL